MKKFASLILALSLCLGLSAPAQAAQGGSSSYAYGPYEFTTAEGLVYRFESACASREVLTFGVPAEDGSGYQAVQETVNLVTVNPAPDLQVFVQDSAGEDVFRKVPAYEKVDGMYCLRTDIQYDTFTTDNVNYWFGDPSEMGYSPLLETTDAQGNRLFLRSGHEPMGEPAGDGAAQPGGTGTAFADVAADAYYADAVAWAVEKGITTGISATSFSPERTCTTEEILTFLWRANGSPASTSEPPFDVMEVNDYYGDAVRWAYEQGLVSDDGFLPGAPATRAATVTYLWKLSGRPSVAPAAFTDVDADAEYAQAVAWAVEQGVTTGTGAGDTFSPDGTCTRGQIVTFLHRYLGE